MTSVGVVVNCYERTYRGVLVPGFFRQVVAQNRFPFDEVVALINNVDDRAEATERAVALVNAGEISSFAFVADHLDQALRSAGLSPRALRRRPYLLDYGIAMPHAVSTDWLLGWDAETQLLTPTDWVTPSIDLMLDDPRIFHASLSWPARPEEPGALGEAVEVQGQFALNYGFSDQLFLLRRRELMAPIYRSFAPAALTRHAPHPYTFEYRVEAHQRAVRRMRASLISVEYAMEDYGTGVVDRTGRTRRDAVEYKALSLLDHYVVRHLPRSMGPRFSK
ncbi:hypothetical protein FHX52_1896 [Humibacillus xanthopallidus]|uniref:Glycosyl transferase family 2 n=1 Tax=Humibacillus xanthopallidus TaxID=412689 RepID=A0A543PXH5_9MICO|nr:hypothetical protein [Humibacillus xanthopallidus]TQN48750.1 hypothetical protein FHX52_1896 [Humibacillus xanthopallidus]